MIMIEVGVVLLGLALVWLVILHYRKCRTTVLDGTTTCSEHSGSDTATPGPVKRVPENAPGDFYVIADACIQCGTPHRVAPDLMDDPERLGKDHQECYFRKQPRTSDEFDRAASAVEACCVNALRYGGRDPEILKCLRDVPDRCDHASECQGDRS